jgi:HipA-like protein
VGSRLGGIVTKNKINHMRAVEVYRNKILAGILVEENRHQFVFKYDDNYFNNDKNPAISLTLPKTKKEYSSPFLFPFFFNMLSEGANRKLQSRHLHIDEDDNFGILMETAQTDTVGAVTVKPILMNKRVL